MSLIYSLRSSISFYSAMSIPRDARYFILSVVVVFDIDGSVANVEYVLETTLIDKATLQRSTGPQSHRKYTCNDRRYKSLKMPHPSF